MLSVILYRIAFNSWHKSGVKIHIIIVKCFPRVVLGFKCVTFGWTLGELHSLAEPLLYLWLKSRGVDRKGRRRRSGGGQRFPITCENLASLSRNLTKARTIYAKNSLLQRFRHIIKWRGDQNHKIVMWKCMQYKHKHWWSYLGGE